MYGKDTLMVFGEVMKFRAVACIKVTRMAQILKDHYCMI